MCIRDRPNMIQDHQPAEINKFLGLYGIDEFDDSVPLGYFIDELNTITYGDSVRTRDGFGIDWQGGGIVQFAIYRRQGEAARIIILNPLGQIWDLTANINILTNEFAKGFAINYYNNRALISPHDGVSGLPGEFTYSYDGEGPGRKLGGLAPAAGFVAILSGTSCVIEKGKHIFAITFETESGFVTEPSEAQVVDADGLHS